MHPALTKIVATHQGEVLGYVMKAPGEDPVTFKNTSNQVCQDGDLIVKPGESFSTEDESRIDQLTNQYAWQFDAVTGEKAPHEADAKGNGPKGVRPSVGNSFVEVDAEDKQPKKIG